jgi:endonuclease/exonuclease/phosphatase family metal-dependent hydrolase
MDVKVATFNLNNLFSRYDFRADVATADASTVKVEERTSFSFADPQGFKLRTYQGRLVRGKDPADRTLLADRIKTIDADVLCVQEVEDIDTLRQFARDDLGGMYREVVLIEGNDPRLIDLGLLSKLRVGAVTSWQYTRDPLNPTETLFSRDLLQVEIRSDNGKERLFTVFSNHLKSHFVPFTSPDPDAEETRANKLRKRQCEAGAAIIEAVTRPDSRYLVVGDMNDPPDSEWMAPLAASAALNLTNALEDAKESPKAPVNPPPPNEQWTERFKPAGQPAVYTLMDQIWLSPALAAKQTAAGINRRTRLGGDGSDHDPSWVTLSI